MVGIDVQEVALGSYGHLSPLRAVELTCNQTQGIAGHP